VRRAVFAESALPCGRVGLAGSLLDGGGDPVGRRRGDEVDVVEHAALRPRERAHAQVEE
jgi:hypothetical protein